MTTARSCNAHRPGRWGRHPRPAIARLSGGCSDGTQPALYLASSVRVNVRSLGTCPPLSQVSTDPSATQAKGVGTAGPEQLEAQPHQQQQQQAHGEHAQRRPFPTRPHRGSVVQAQRGQTSDHPADDRPPNTTLPVFVSGRGSALPHVAVPCSHLLAPRAAAREPQNAAFFVGFSRLAVGPLLACSAVADARVALVRVGACHCHGREGQARLAAATAATAARTTHTDACRAFRCVLCGVGALLARVASPCAVTCNVSHGAAAATASTWATPLPNPRSRRRTRPRPGRLTRWCVTLMIDRHHEQAVCDGRQHQPPHGARQVRPRDPLVAARPTSGAARKIAELIAASYPDEVLVRVRVWMLLRICFAVRNLVLVRLLEVRCAGVALLCAD